MSGELWVVRAGEKAKFVDEFVAGSYVAVGFDELAADDLDQTDEAVLRARASGPAERTYASQLISFAYRMQVGDLVIVPRLTNKRRDYLVARVSGPYRHVVAASASGHHHRDVEWLGKFSRDALSTAGTNTMGAIQTVFRPSAIDAELRALLTGLDALEASETDTGSAKPQPARLISDTSKGHLETPTRDSLPVRVVPAVRPLVSAQLDIELDSQGRARILSAHPALVMEQTPRHVDPAQDWAGVPGIYVLTGTDLEQSSARTGNERTLTTTFIVRPWGYVGLSEDFLGRLSSHRQSKPEWRRALLVRSGAQPFSSDDLKYLERAVHTALRETGEVLLAQATPRGNLSAQPRNPGMLDACAGTVVAVLRLTGTLI